MLWRKCYYYHTHFIHKENKARRGKQRCQCHLVSKGWNKDLNAGVSGTKVYARCCLTYSAEGLLHEL